VILLTELSVGTLLLTGLLPPREIRLSFFTFNSLLGALSAAVALTLMKFGVGSAWWEVRFLGLTVIGATVAFGFFRLEKAEIARIVLILSGLLGLMLGLLPLSGQILALREIDTTAGFFFDASFLAGAALLGATTVGMILGHWYLVMRRLSFEYLEQFAKIILGAVLFRIVLAFGTLITMKSFDPKLWDLFSSRLFDVSGAGAFFFLLRIALGLAAPLVLAYMILRTVKERANQAATGLLYVMEISVLFGELLAAYLLI
jgi:hypothetical protein